MQTYAKKIAETDAIFENVHRVNRIADETQGVIRISIDTKATVDIGPFSRKGKCRTGNKACDHDYDAELELKLFGTFLPELDETYFYFTSSNATADFMVDMIEGLWPMLKERFDSHTIVLNADNGPDNSSSRTQFMKRLVVFCHSEKVSLELAYYPPYHSKYNPIERVWGVLGRPLERRNPGQRRQGSRLCQEHDMERQKSNSQTDLGDI